MYLFLFTSYHFVLDCFQSLLMHIDSLIYVDTDIIFLSPLEELWSFFAHFNGTQLVALAPEHEDANVGWYNRFARHPYYGPLGKYCVIWCSKP